MTTKPLQENPGRQGMEITNGVVAVYREYLGRGPETARTLLHADAVVVVLGETLTKAERRLVQDGEGEAVIALRRRFQQTMRDDLVGAVEAVLDRRVVSFMSDHTPDPDFACEVFLLEHEHGEPLSAVV
ncbi:MAG TPA: DUF2294 domain-containing protein [Solirubrobacteraceae bacterium]|nr:DUF2294 domain-containing protein [Solirubrobacteraceae bacterium]